MRRTAVRLIYGAAVFVIAVLVLELMMNRGSADSTAAMSAASFPVVTMESAGGAVNELHGYTQARDLRRYRGVITPIGADREVAFTVNPYGQTITALSFEVRSVDGARLIEDGAVTDYAQDEDGLIAARIKIKDLIEQEEEYMLVLLFVMPSGQELRYYTRIVASETNDAAEKIAFVYRFHEATFSKTAASAVATYIEPSAEGDNSSYAKVDIHSSYGQITWGDLAPEQEGEAVVRVLDMQPETAMLSLRYFVTVEKDGGRTRYVCEERYRLRMGETRINLLEFERTMEQVFVPSEAGRADGVLSLGIADPQLPFAESDGGGAFAFVQGGRLYACTTIDGSVAYVYGFADFGSLDARDTFADHAIRILNVDETGNVDFLVCGYMNRGRHEGELGAAVFSYNSVFRTVEERAFLPYAGSYELLKAQVERLCYLNKSNSLFLLIDETLCEVNLTNRTVHTVRSGLAEGSFQVSRDGQMIAWTEKAQDGADVVALTDLSTLEEKKITAAAGERLAPMGFIGEDLIYGTARQEDVLRDPTGSETLPMYRVRIVDGDLQLLENYEVPGYYVTACEVEGNQITLKRLTTGENSVLAGASSDGSAAADTSAAGASSASGVRFSPAPDDQIIDAEEAQTGVNYLRTASTQEYETVCEIRAKGLGDELKYVWPKEVLFEGSRDLALPEAQSAGKRYFVYGLGGVQGVYTRTAQAVQAAEQSGGSVVESGRYIWRKGNRAAVNQIMAITAREVQDGESALAVCLQAILDFEGTAQNAAVLLSQGQDVGQVLSESLPGAAVLDLTGCSLDAVLYYISEEKPVLVTTDDEGGAVLLVGYNEQEVVVMDPSAGTLYKKSRSETEELLGRSGTGMVSYL